MSAEPPSGASPVAASAGLAALVSLWAVRQVDLRLAALRAERAGLDDGTALREESEAARAAATEAAGRLHGAQATLRDQELQLATTETKQKKAEGDLYGGRISNPKELAGLEEEIGVLAKSLDHLQDNILGLFDEVEELRRQDAERRAAARALEERLAAHMTVFERERGRIDTAIAATEAERAGLATAVEPRLLKKYENIAAQEGGVGMVAIAGGFCGGCHNDVPARFVSRVRAGDVVTCERCHRILYLDGPS